MPRWTWFLAGRLGRSLPMESGSSRSRSLSLINQHIICLKPFSSAIFVRQIPYVISYCYKISFQNLLKCMYVCIYTEWATFGTHLESNYLQVPLHRNSLYSASAQTKNIAVWVASSTPVTWSLVAIGPPVLLTIDNAINKLILYLVKNANRCEERIDYLTAVHLYYNNRVVNLLCNLEI